MVEELKVIADILQGVSGEAIKGIIVYLTLAYLKPVTVTTIICGSVCYVVKTYMNKFNNSKVVEFKEL